MPCFDKKLEASRRDFYDEVQQSKDVDCVLTTGVSGSLLIFDYRSSIICRLPREGPTRSNDRREYD